MEFYHADISNAWRGRTALVTGISGFVGGWVAATLLDYGAEVIGVVRKKPGDANRVTTLRLLDLERRAHLVVGSVVDYELIERILSEYEVDTVFHLAAETIVGIAKRSPIPFFESNIMGTWNVLEAVRASSRVERVIVASSDKAYGDQDELPYREGAILNGLYPYDASKACTDILARTYAHTYGLPIVVTRCANVFGGADLNWSRLVPGTIRAMMQNENPVLRSDGMSERDYIYVTDAVNAYLQAGANVHRDGVCGRAFNFGSGVGISARAMVDTLLHIAGRTDLTPEVRGRGKPEGEIDRQYLDSREANSVLGWHQQVDLTTGLKQTIKWYQERAAPLQIAKERVT